MQVVATLTLTLTLNLTLMRTQVVATDGYDACNPM